MVEGERRKHERRCDPDTSRCDFADEAAERAVERTFAVLGVDVHDPGKVKEFQENLRFGEGMRKMAQKSLAGFCWAVGLSAAGWFIFKVQTWAQVKP